LDLFRSVMFLNNSAYIVSVVYFIFLNDMINVSEERYDRDRQYYLACTSIFLFMSRAIELHSRAFASDRYDYEHDS
jgi:hypothetical protein